jgi:hypothetical protein
MGKPAIDPVDAGIRGYDARFSAPPISGLVLGYEGDRNDPSAVVALVKLLEPHREFGLGAGEQIRVATSVHPDDANVLVSDLAAGSAMFDVPACAPGSLVDFEGCTKRDDEPEYQASRFTVVTAVPYMRFEACEPHAIKTLPEVGQVITDFNVFTGGSPREATAQGWFVVEEVTKQADGQGHGPHDVYPGGHRVTARRLHPDGSYDPFGAVVHPTMGADRSAGDNGQFRVVGSMISTPSADAEEDATPAPGIR